ncbi:MAG: hypothetical protein WDW38_008725 [Sanguina aurantia]
MARNREKLVGKGLLKAVAGLGALKAPPPMPEVPTLSSEAELTFTQEAVAPSVSATAPAPARKPARRQHRLDDPSDDDGDWAPPTAEELSQAAAVAAKPKSKKRKAPASESEKLSELELSGLVDMNEQEAVFVVLGSTAKHYYVRLRDAQHVCDCIDHKTRRHDCKHIRLILTSLGLGHTAHTSPNSGWRAAVKLVFTSSLAERARAARGE